MIEIKLTARSKKTINQLLQVSQDHKVAIENGFYDLGKITQEYNRKLIINGPKTGRIYRINGRAHQASAPGEPPANLTGRLARSTDFAVHGWRRMTYGQSAPYAKFLENGTRFIAPRPNVSRSVRYTQSTGIELFHNRFKEQIK